ncbi:MAG: thiamine diphosphokinase [Erysipelotrichaceae bacterium]|nr:thiamine diphosphokinase [Erysipelotrichaceae bacterium]
MKDIVLIVTNLATELPEKIDADYIGVDGGALFLASQKIKMVAAIGDFDSINKNDLAIIKKYTDKIIEYPSVKDYSDSELAIKYATTLNYQHLIVIGGIGKRLDHSLNNLILLDKYSDFDITIRDYNNKAYILKPGIHMLAKSHYQYFSFFTLTDSELSLIGFKYPLNNQKLDKYENIGLSNEIIDDFATIIIQTGKILCVQSNDQNK